MTDEQQPPALLSGPGYGNGKTNGATEPAAATEPDRASVTEAASKLALSGVGIDQIQTLLEHFLHELSRTERRPAHEQHEQLVEANEQLLIAALTNQVHAENAALALKDALRATLLDELTHLPNRAAMLDRAAQAIANARRRGACFALLFVDLDNFKHINDKHGHDIGDKALCLSAERMLAAVREMDTVSRHGGDEFLILLTDLAEPADAGTVAEKLIASLKLPAEIDGVAVRLSASIGIAIFPDDGSDVDTLLKLADVAMYQSKRRGAGGIAFHGAPWSTDQELTPRAQEIAARLLASGKQIYRRVHLDGAGDGLLQTNRSKPELPPAARSRQQRQTEFVSEVMDELRRQQSGEERSDRNGSGEQH
jgi:diguanylate cyclase